VNKRQNIKGFKGICQKTDEVLNNPYKPLESLTRIVILLSLIFGILFFLLAPSIDKTLLLIPLLLNMGLKLKDNKKEQKSEITISV
jgi:hypothetical protein